jgi:hypothetical protein
MPLETPQNVALVNMQLMYPRCWIRASIKHLPGLHYQCGLMRHVPECFVSPA